MSPTLQPEAHFNVGDDSMTASLGLDNLMQCKRHVIQTFITGWTIREKEHGQIFL